MQFLICFITYHDLKYKKYLYVINLQNFFQKYQIKGGPFNIEKIEITKENRHYSRIFGQFLFSLFFSCWIPQEEKCFREMH